MTIVGRTPQAVVGTQRMAEAARKSAFTQDALSRLLTRGVRVATSEEVTGLEPRMDEGLSSVDIGEFFQDKPPNFNAQLLMPRQYAERPELFFGPFLQLGTFLDVGPEWVNFAIDIVTDPLTYVPLPGLRLAKVGQQARMTSALSQAGRFKKGSEVVDEALRVIERVAGIVDSEVGPKLMELARKGDRGFARELSRAMKSGRLSDTDSVLAAAMKKDRKVLASILDNVEDFAKLQDVTAGPLALGATRAARVSLQQQNPLFRIAIPANPVKHPLRFTSQVLGFGYRGEKFFAPFARRGSSGLRNVGAGSLMSVGGRVGGTAAEQAFEGGARAAAGDQTAAHVEILSAHWQAVFGVGNDRMISALHRDILPAALEGGELQNLLKREFRLTQGMKPNATVDVGSEAFQQFTEKRLQRLNRNRRFSDMALNERRNKGIADAASSVRGLINTGQIDNALGENLIVQIRRVQEIFSLESLMTDPEAMVHSLGALGGFVSLMAHTTVTSSREVLERVIAKGGPADDIAEALQFVLSSPDLWTRDETGRFFLKPLTDDEFNAILKIPEGESSRFLDLLKVRSPSRTKGKRVLQQYLTDTGLDPEIGRVIDSMRTTLASVGNTLVHDEQILNTLLSDYFARIFIPNRKFFGQTPKTGRRRLDEFMRRALDGEDVPKELSDIITQVRGRMDKLRQGKVTMQETRVIPEFLAQKLEDLGLGEFKKDTFEIYGLWLESAGKSIVLNRFVRDLPDVSGFLPRSLLGERGEGIHEREFRRLRIVMRADDIPASAKHLYTEVKIRPRGRNKIDDVEYMMVNALADGGLDEARRRARWTAKTQIGAEINGKTRITLVDGKERVLVSKGGDPIPFDENWLWQGKRGLPAEGRGEIRIGNEVLSPGSVRRDIARLIRKREAEIMSKARVRAEGLRVELAAKRMKLEVEGKLPKDNTRVMVFADYAGQVQETFRIWEHKGPISEWGRAWETIIRTTKGYVLMGDVFHYNTLAVQQLWAGGPSNFMRLLLDPDGKWLPGAREGAFARGPGSPMAAFSRSGAGRAARLQTVKLAGGGAVGGATLGAGLGGDEEDVATFSLIGALYGALLGATRLNAIYANRIAMNPDNAETLLAMAKGGWTGRPDDRSIGIIDRHLRLARNQLARNEGNTFLIHAIDKVRHLSEAWNQELWETVHNGSKHFVFSALWAQDASLLRNSPDFVKATQQQQQRMLDGLSRQLMQFSNNAMGGQRFAFLFQQPEWNFSLQNILLAPDWTTGRLAIATNMMMNLSPPGAAALGGAIGASLELADLGFDPEHFTFAGPVAGGVAGLAMQRWAQGIARRMLTRGDRLAYHSRRLATGYLVSGLAMANIANFAFTGRFMWENEEGKKLSIQLPGKDPRGRDRFITLGKSMKEAWEAAGVTEREGVGKIPVFSRLSSKLNVPARLGVRMLSNHNGYGPIFVGNETPWDWAGKVADLTIDSTAPIIFQGIGRAGRQALTQDRPSITFSEAVLGSAGFRVRKGQRGLVGSDINAVFTSLQPGPPENIGAVPPPFPEFFK